MIIVPGQGVGLVGDGGNNEVATFTDAYQIQGEANLTFDGSTLTVTGALTVGVDGTGHDVIFYGDTSGKKITWDESEDTLLVTNETAFTFGTDKDVAIAHRATSLAADAAWSIGSTVIIEGTDDHPGVAANSFVISNVTNDGDIMFAVSDAGNSIGALKLKGADGSVNVHKDLIVNSSLQVATIDYTDGDLAMTIADGGGVTFANTVTVGVDDAGYDVKFFGNTASAYTMWDTSADDLVFAGAAGIASVDSQLPVKINGQLQIDANMANLYIKGGGANTGPAGIVWGFGETVTLHTTLAEALDDSETDIDVTSASGLTTGDFIRIDDEIMDITGISTNTLTVTRGFEGTVAAEHDNGTNVYNIPVRYASMALDFDTRGSAGEGLKIKSANGYMMTLNAGNDLAFQTDDVTRMTISNGGSISTTSTVSIMTSDTGFNTAYDDLIVGSGSGDTGMFIYSGSSDIGGLMFHDAANTSLSGFVTYDHNIDYLYFGTGGLGRISMYGGTSPVLRIGIGQEYDTTLLFDGHQLDVYMAVDDSGDNFKIGTGTTVGSNAMLQMDASNTYSYNDFKPAADSTYSLGSTSYGWSTLYLSDTGASADEGPTIQMYTKSASPAVNDQLGSVLWYGRNDADQDTIYGKIRGRAVDPADGTEDGRLDFYTTVNGNTGTIGMYLNQHGDLNIVRNLQMNQAATAQDSMVWWDGNAQDYYIGLDDSADALTFGHGSTVGSSVSFYINSSAEAVYVDNLVMTDGKFLKWGSAPDYAMYYDNTNTRWAMGSYDGDGSGTDLDLIRINDGQTTIDANTTFDANAFDIYDDAMLLASSISPTADAYDFGKGVFKRGREALIEVGILKEYEDGWVGYNDQRMAALLAGGIYQTRQLVDEMKEEINKLRKQVTALGG